MIDGFKPRRPVSHVRPVDRENMSQMIVGDHSGKSTLPPQAGHLGNAAVSAGPGSGGPNPPTSGSASKNRSLPAWLRGVTKRQWIVAACVFMLLIGTGVATFLIIHHEQGPVAVHVTKRLIDRPKVEVVTTVPANLTGLPVDPSVNQLPVTGVMIENSTFARPQSGLDKAGVVFEAVAEGGITRFLTLFQSKDTPDYLGPVRSVRPYYIRWALGFNASVAHVGGSPEALADMRNWGVRDLDQFANGSYYHRINSRDAPHNVYTSLAELSGLEDKKGYGTSTYGVWPRKKDTPSKTPNASSVDLTISYGDYNVHYDYDTASNSYKRSEGGAAHMELDKNGNQTQITPKVVIALVMNQGIEADDLHTSYDTIGTGHMYVFQDGVATEGTWSKPNDTTNFSFTDMNGKPLPLNAGQSWVTAVSATKNVAYK